MGSKTPAGILKIKEILHRQESIEHIATTLALAEKSLFALLISDNTFLFGDFHQSDLALGILAQEVFMIIENPVVFLHFAFKKNGKELHENTTVELLIDRFLKPLYYWNDLKSDISIRSPQMDRIQEVMSEIRTFEFLPDNSGIPREGICFGYSDLPKTWEDIHLGKLIFALDFSRAGKQDKEPLSVFFQHMNEARDPILRKIPGLFLLILPPFLETEFSVNAADFWSVCSVAAHLISPETKERSPKNLPRIEVSHASFFEFEKQEILQQLGKIRVEFDNEPVNPYLAKSMIIWLTRLGNYERENGSISSSLDAFEESLHIARKFCGQFPSDPDWLKKLCACLENCGEMYLILGETEKGFEAFKESIEIMRSLLTIDSEQEWQNDLARILFRRGDIFIDSEDMEKAFSDHQESLEIRKFLAEIKPDFPPYLYNIAVSYSRLALIYEEREDIVSAMDNLKKTVSILKSLTEQNPGIKDWRNAFDFCTEQLTRLEKRSGKS